MLPKEQIIVSGTDVYTLTGKGNNELRGAKTGLSLSELELLVHIDGRSTVAEIIASAQSLKADASPDLFQKLVQKELIELVEFFGSESLPPSANAMTEAYQEVSAGVSSLQKQGYYVRIARRAATERKLVEGQRLSVVVVEDEPHLVKFLKQFFKLEGFDARIATNRNEIVGEFRRPPRPDLVVLDVMLPDADGFDILLKMRQHPDLKTVPVVMLTAKATREAVLKGLACGADGYITKPFEVDVLIKAVKAVLGLPEN